MNSENVISLQSALAEPAPFRAMKVTANGLDYAGAGDRVIGFTLPGDLNRNYPTVQLHASYIEAVLGNGTDVVRGDELEQAANGQYVKRTTGAVAGVAWSGATESGDRFEAFIFRPLAQGAAVAVTSTNGTAAAASANLAGLAAETEKVGDELRALIASLQAAGIIA